MARLPRQRARSTITLPAAVIILVGCVTPFLFAGQNQAPTQSPREQLNEDIAQLQKSPSDDALREKIIKLALTIQPTPAIPREAVEHEGAAEYAFKNAKSPADFTQAAGEYEKALLIAPWVAADYFNLGLAREKSGDLQKAIDSYRLYLLASPEAKDADDVIKRIGALKFRLQKSQQQQAAAAQQQQEQANEAEEDRQQHSGLYAFWQLVRDKQYKFYACGFGPVWNPYVGNGHSVISYFKRYCTWADTRGQHWWYAPGNSCPYSWSSDVDSYSNLDAALLSCDDQSFVGLKVFGTGPSIEDLQSSFIRTPVQPDVHVDPSSWHIVSHNSDWTEIVYCQREGCRSSNQPEYFYMLKAQ